MNAHHQPLGQHQVRQPGSHRVVGEDAVVEEHRDRQQADEDVPQPPAARLLADAGDVEVAGEDGTPAEGADARAGGATGLHGLLGAAFGAFGPVVLHAAASCAVPPASPPEHSA